jgi:hypothetical protein
MRNIKKLIFIYNGNSGLVNGIIHLLHKKFSPQTYDCRLCAILYDGIRHDAQWNDFIQTLHVATEYYHRDTFIKRYGALHQALPVVLAEEEDGTRTIGISADTFQTIHTMEQMQQHILSLCSRQEPCK